MQHVHLKRTTPKRVFERQQQNDGDDGSDDEDVDNEDDNAKWSKRKVKMFLPVVEKGMRNYDSHINFKYLEKVTCLMKLK
jgi:hypothetical protein